MPRSLTAADRTALIKFATSLPKGDEGRRAILAGLAKTAKRDWDNTGKGKLDKSHPFSLMRLGTDFSEDETVVEYAAQELMKRKSSSVAAVAKYTAKRLSGGVNAFIGGGHQEVEIDPRLLEQALWEYLSDFLKDQIKQFRPGMEAMALQATANLYKLTPQDTKTLAAKASI